MFRAIGKVVGFIVGTLIGAIIGGIAELIWRLTTNTWKQKP